MSAWDLSSPVYDSALLDLSNQVSTSFVDGRFSADGTSFYAVDETATKVYQYTLGTAWDLSTATYASKSFTAVGTSTVFSLSFKSNGAIMYLMFATVASVSVAIFEYTLSTPWDVSTAVLNGKNFNPASPQAAAPTYFRLENSGAKMYIVDGNSAIIYQYTLSTPWDVSSASYDSKSFDSSTQVTDTSAGIDFKSDGTKMYLGSDGGTNTMYQYTLATPWDISTATYDTISYQDAIIQGLGDTLSGVAFKSDGTKMYTFDINATGGGAGAGAVYQYSLGAAAGSGNIFVCTW